VGIPEHLIKNIFEELCSDQKGGNWDGIGLGLPICLRLATETNSFIRYGSKPGISTVFRFYVPLVGRGIMEPVVQVTIAKENLAIRISNLTNSDHCCSQIYLAEDSEGISEL